jgi:hypothetical protein
MARAPRSEKPAEPDIPITDDPADIFWAKFGDLVNQMKQATAALAATSRGIDEQAAKQAAMRIAVEVPAAMRQVALRVQRRLIVHGIGIAVLAMAIGVCAGYFVHAHDISGMQCQDQDGGRICYLWVKPAAKGDSK